VENPSAKNASEDPQNRAQNKQALLNDIRAKWSKFSEQDVSALKDKADLVTQVSTKYDIKREQAQRDVDALLKGRQIGAGA
jgi:hypothetical protein